MATRIFLPGVPLWLPPEPPPTYAAAWNDTTPGVADFSHVICTVLADPGTAYNSGNSTTDNVSTNAGPANIVLRTFVTVPLSGDQTITGTLKGQQRYRESNASANAMAQLVVRVFAPDMATVRGTLYGGHTNALSSEFLHTGFQNRKNPLAALSPVSLSSVNALDGDVIVLETGARKTEAGTTSRTYRIGGSCDSATQLPEDETATANDAGWFEFSQDLVFQEHAPRIGSRMLMGIGG